MKKCNTIYEQVNDNTKDIEIIKSQLPFKYYRYDGTLTTESTTCLKSKVNAPLDTIDGYIIGANGNLFKIDGANDEYYLLTYYANLKGTKGDRGEKGNDGAKGDKGDDGKDGETFDDIEDANYIVGAIASVENGFQINGQMQIQKASGDFSNFVANVNLPIKAEDGINADVNEDGDTIIIKQSELTPFTLTATEQATSGTITPQEMAELTSNLDRKINLNGELYSLQDNKTSANYLVYTHVGQDNTQKFYTKCITFTISTNSWVLTTQEIGASGGELYQHNINFTRSGTSDEARGNIIILNKDATEFTNENLYAFLSSNSSQYFNMSGYVGLVQSGTSAKLTCVIIYIETHDNAYFVRYNSSSFLRISKTDSNLHINDYVVALT